MDYILFVSCRVSFPKKLGYLSSSIFLALFCLSNETLPCRGILAAFTNGGGYFEHGVKLDNKFFYC